MNIHISRYEKFIDARKNRKSQDGIKYEEHHILPKSMGGNNSKENLVLLTPREHYIAHLILWKAYGSKASRAFWMISHKKDSKNHLTSKQYQTLKESLIISEETREKMRKSQLGKKHTPDHINKVLESKNKKSQEEKNKTYKKISNALKGKKRLDSVKEKIKFTKQNNKYIYSAEIKEKMRLAALNRTEETRKKAGEAQKKRFEEQGVSEETRKKLREASKKYWQRKKEGKNND